MNEADDIIAEVTVAEIDGQITAVRECLTIIDGVLHNIGNTNICSSAEMTDSLLDLRNLLSPLAR